MRFFLISKLSEVFYMESWMNAQVTVVRELKRRCKRASKYSKHESSTLKLLLHCKKSLKVSLRIFFNPISTDSFRVSTKIFNYKNYGSQSQD